MKGFRKEQSKRTAKERDKKNKMVVLRKRQVAAVSLILLIGIAGYLNLAVRKQEADPSVAVMYNQTAKRLGEAKMVNGTGNNAEANGVKNNDAAVGTDYFTTAKTQRDMKRSETVETLTEVLNSPGADQASKDNAKKQLDQLTNFSEAELTAETMITAKGYGNCVVFMGETATSVAVETNGLNEIDAAVICELVAENGNIPPEQITIVEIKPN